MNLSTDVKKTWLGLFSLLWRGVLSGAQIHAQPPPLTITFSDRLSSKRGVRIRGAGSFVIEVSTKFALDLHAELRTVEETLVALAFRSSRARRARHGEVLAIVEEFTISFILLHEIYHLIGGHMAWVARRPSGLTFDEQRFGLHFALGQHGLKGSAPSYALIADAYLLESEADCSAIQWIVQEMSQPRLQRLLGTRAEHMTFFSGRQRLVSFRLCLASVWLAIRRLESAREELMRNESRTHPLPVTRLFAAFGTFIQHYSSISDMRFDSQGGANRKLTESDVISMREFLRQVLNPVLTSDWNPGSPHVPPESLEARLLFYLRDFGNHMLKRPVETVVGRELLRMERARFRMDRRLRPFRYHHAVKLRIMK
jgi:hypothetical protein